MRYTCHQPMLFAPIYLWARFASVDRLVLLNTDWMKKDGWHTRFKLNTKGGSVIIPASIRGSRFDQRIRDTEFYQPARFFEKLVKTLQQTYGRFETFNEIVQLIAPDPTTLEWETFGAYTNRVTKQLAGYLNLETLVIDDDTLSVERPTDASCWLAQLGQAIGGHTYVCAADAPEKYLDRRPFDDRLITLDPQRYTMPAYPGSSDACTSILDLVFRLPMEQAREVVCGHR